MKKLYILLLITGCVFSACDSVKDLQPAINMSEAVPQAAVNAVRQEFPDATQLRFSTLERDKLWESNFQYKADRMSAIVNNLGKISETYKISSSIQLPANAQTYITNNYPGAAIKNVCQQVIPNSGASVGYKVIITLTDGKDIVVVFDATGTLLMVAANDRPGSFSGGPGGPPKIYFIEEKEIPEIIRAYLAGKHPYYTFIKAAVSIQGGSKFYSVAITKDLTSFDYLFDEKGNVLRTGTLGFNAPFNKLEYRQIVLTDLPKAIKEGLNLNFSNWIYENGITYSQNGQLQGYFILVTADKKQFSLQFDFHGEFIRGMQVCGPPGASSGKYEIKAIQPKDLPDAITGFLTNKYQEFGYMHTALINDKDKKVYWIAIIKDNFILNYSFDDKGRILSAVESLLKLNPGKVAVKSMQAIDITEKIRSYCNTFYSGWVFQTGLINIVDNQLFSYITVIKVGSDSYILSFDANSDFIAARKG